MKHYQRKKLIDERKPTVAQISNFEMLIDNITKALPNENFKQQQELLRMSIKQKKKKSART